MNTEYSDVCGIIPEDTMSNVRSGLHVVSWSVKGKIKSLHRWRQIRICKYWRQTLKNVRFSAWLENCFSNQTYINLSYSRSYFTEKIGPVFVLPKLLIKNLHGLMFYLSWFWSLSEKSFHKMIKTQFQNITVLLNITPLLSNIDLKQIDVIKMQLFAQSLVTLSVFKLWISR